MTKVGDSVSNEQLPTVVDDAMVVTTEVVTEETPMTLAEATKLRDAILSLKALMGRNYYELGRFLCELVHRPLESSDGGRFAYNAWGFNTFGDYCEAELGFKERKAHHLVKIYRSTQAGPLPLEFVENTEWSKLAMVTPLVDKGIITDRNVSSWVEKLAGKTFQDVRQMTKLALEKAQEKAKEQLAGATSSNSPDSTEADPEEDITAPEEVFAFRAPLYQGQWENWQVALSKAEKLSGTNNVSHLMDYIALAFNSEGFTTATDSLDEICRRVERVFGVRVLALHADDTSKVMFGEKLAQLIRAHEKTHATYQREEKKLQQEAAKLGAVSAPTAPETE